MIHKSNHSIQNLENKFLIYSNLDDFQFLFNISAIVLITGLLASLFFLQQQFFNICKISNLSLKNWLICDVFLSLINFILFYKWKFSIKVERLEKKNLFAIEIS